MRIVIDTNVVISGVFFGGAPRRVLDAVIDSEFNAFASVEIVDEYREIVDEMISRKQGNINRGLLNPLLQKMTIIDPAKKADVCRDPDDNKFLDCARDSQALYIVSGDIDLLVLEHYENTDINHRKRILCKVFIVSTQPDIWTKGQKAKMLSVLFQIYLSCLPLHTAGAVAAHELFNV